MRSGNWRGVTLALGLSCALALTFASTSRGDGFIHTIPSLVPAVDVNTGGPYMAPPVPYGHYAGKDLGGKLGKHLGFLHGGGGLGGCGHGGACGDPAGCGGRGLCGMGGGGGGGCGRGGLFHKCGAGQGCFAPTSTYVMSSEQGMPTPQSYYPSPQCGDPGCGGFGHKHKGCGDPCGSCGGKGCGLCGLGGLGKGGLCGACGGAGCAACSKVKGLVNHLLHRDKIKWFVGPGGPVPLTPGYTPYIVTTRSPRDFLAFPPFTP